VNKVTQSDALGGEGSLSAGVRSIAVNGLSRLVDGYLSRKYPLTSLNENYAIEGGGAYEATNAPGKPRSAPQPGSKIGAGTSLSSPVVLAVGGVLIVALVLVVALRR
jgi:hypothetical protein